MRRFIFFILFLLSVSIFFADTSGILSTAEIAQLVDMLDSAGLTSNSLKFEKDWDLSTKYKLNWQLNQLQNPWLALEDIQHIKELCDSSESGELEQLLRELGGIAFNLNPYQFTTLYPSAKSVYNSQLKKEVQKPEDIFKWLDAHLKNFKEEFNQVTRDVNRNRLMEFQSYWLWQFIEAEDTLTYKSYFAQKNLPEYSKLNIEKLEKEFSRLHFDLLLQSGIKFLALSDALAEHCNTLKFNNKSPIIKRTDSGYMIIGTKADDVYKDKKLSPICFLLDPAGNDRYEIELKTSLENPFYIFIDLQGNDLYRNLDIASMFCSEYGFGYSLDLSGDDIYQTGDFSFASFTGINLHQDKSGDDFYQSGLFSQGAAMFGLAAIIDFEGNDSYKATCMAQGFGSTYGAGAILDFSGADVYYLGGKYFHEPLMPLDYLTLGQGMGFGLRPDMSGGLGLLFDSKGNDKYLGGVYAQGSGYWYATGLLIDISGNDVYNTVYYPQGSGIHLACGFLLDESGDDAYYSRNGPGQGAGHDWALGIFIDSSGNDAYSIPGGNGLGLTNSVGIFIDKCGDDRYERQYPQNYGYANYSRSTGGIGLFLDAGGTDTYPDTLKANNSSWYSGTYGIGRDIELNRTTKTEIEKLSEEAPLPKETDKIEEIFAAASEWEVGSAVKRVQKGREILVQRADEAIPFIISNKINTQSSLEYRALETLAAKSPKFIQELYKVIDKEDSLAAKNALSLIAETGDTLLLDYVERLLNQKKYETTCISVLGAINSEKSVNLLKNYIHHPSERFRYLAARSLKQIKHPSAREALMLMKDDTSFLVQALLRNLPPEIN
ncbi:MAG TPA: HEAT repeat domain-containing protein [Candidatus Syntrophosphaera thermopropionivorans]|mgnify:FL=1|jgi:hypothetical protein|nr:HEAT repeat domain-containing protein [Candidatus Cloacimonadota bacterium]HQF82105.1 HEAT repeat domain-containing protein [Candidatus Syntrophosphaera thermopropionivorans]HQK56927.1 HEAT repeat domain-containing protein [Candidatus Syntrophosphaera thermopropionivorans]HQP84284.1 HEAT repeat domain-containing protein [Candidatus Syntrophosphaera thermopropionivorans]